MRTDFEELCFSVVIPLLVAIGIMFLIMAAPSIDKIIFGK